MAMPLTLSIVVLGQHIPPLEFLRILLGNEPALTPREQLYHRLLIGDSVQAAKDADHWLGKSSLAKYLDEVAIPSLRIASDDQNRGALSRQQTVALTETTAEYIQLIRESLDYKREQLAAANPGRPAFRRDATVLVIAGRGSVDHTAAELVSDAIRLDAGTSASCPSLGGLTAISAAAEAASDGGPDIVVLISVGAVTSAQLDLLLRRTQRLFPQSDVVVGYWVHRETDLPGVCYADSATAIIDLVVRIADARANAIPPSRHLEAATM